MLFSLIFLNFIEHQAEYFVFLPEAFKITVSWSLPVSIAFQSFRDLSQLTEARDVLVGLGEKATLTTGPS